MLKYGIMEEMARPGLRAIRDILKERNIILATNDPVVTDGFTQVPNFILKIRNSRSGRR